ncbi:MAG: GNAT family N-acetyltransferase [Clostridia bacterium]|nr:GNAT family N-acetyltransferase [Clostridia bacterium]
MLEFKQIYGLDGYNIAKALREEVFIKEQGFGFDKDDFDEVSWHIVGFDRDTLIGTARVHKSEGNSYKIGRVAVKKEYRGQFIGDLMMKTLQDKIVTLGGMEAVVYSQLSAKGFYEFEGYSQEGEIFEIAGCPHVKMVLDLTKPHRMCNCHK